MGECHLFAYIRSTISHIKLTNVSTYLVTSSIFDYFYTQLIGDPSSMPVIKAASNFDITGGFGIIDSDRYESNSKLAYVATSVFFRQIRNLVFDTTAVPPNAAITAVHWPTAQATSIQNVVFKLSEDSGNKHVGIFMEEGSGGLMNDLVFYGGEYGAQLGNQQYTTRNITFYNCQTAIQQLWNWYWVYKGLTVVNCDVGIEMTSPSVGSAIILDSLFYNTDFAITTNANTTRPGNMTSQDSLVLENVVFINVNTILQGPQTAWTEDTTTGGYFVSGTVLVSIVPVFWGGGYLKVADLNFRAAHISLPDLLLPLVDSMTGSLLRLP